MRLLLILLLLVGLATSASATAITTTATGTNWSSASHWSPAQVPVSGDTVTIANATTVDVTSTCGTSPITGGTTALTINAALTVATGATLIAQGPVVQGNAAVIFNAGSGLEFDAHLAATPATTTYSWTSNAFSRGNRMITCSGTSVSHVTIFTEATSGHGWFLSDSGHNDSMWFNATYTDFTSIGDATNDSISLNPSTDATINVFSHCVFDTGCGCLHWITPPPDAGGWQILDTQFLQTNPKTQGSGKKDNIILAVKATAATGLRQVYRDIFYGAYAGLKGNNTDYQACYFHTGWDSGGTDAIQWLQMLGCLIRWTAPAGSALGSGGRITGSYLLADSVAAAATDSGTSTGGNTTTTLADTAKAWTVNQFASGGTSAWVVEVTGGTGVGQRRLITANTATVLTVAYLWTVTPDATSTFSIYAEGGNFHFSIGNTGITSGNQRWDHNIIDGVISDTQGDSILHLDAASGTTVTYQVDYNILLPNAMGDSVGTLVTRGQNNDTRPVVVEHNTVMPGNQSLISLNENTTGVDAGAGQCTSLRSNICWVVPARAAPANQIQNTSNHSYYWNNGGCQGPLVCNDTSHSGNAASAGALDLVTAGQGDYNCVWGLEVGNGDWSYYNVNASAQLGVHDKNIDPAFVDASRNLCTWAVTRGSAATTISGREADALTYLRADPALVTSSLIPYIQAGFQPTASALRSAAHDGTDIGAVAMAAALGGSRGGHSGRSGESGTVVFDPFGPLVRALMRMPGRN